ncbi:peroxide stress protein YaaA [Pseudonocardiaceae bacterium YIM PH 21723]|nr:peroxide stress protein YaaA [Pseudonocardiaceae bacterium YIM PH 21723]
MLVLLPPSETKADGGDGAPLDLDALSFPELTPTRRKLADALVELAADLPASLAALGLSERQTGEVERNAELWNAPTLPALRRYTGVLYDNLDVASLSKAELGRANEILGVGSALFGVVRAGDAIPGYRLSAGSELPGMPSLRAMWKDSLDPALRALSGLVVDLRSGGYVGLGKVPGALTVRVLSEVDGVRKVVSHFNKAYKGQLVRALVKTRRDVSTVEDVAKVAATTGMGVERPKDLQLDLIVR